MRNTIRLILPVAIVCMCVAGCSTTSPSITTVGNETAFLPAEGIAAPKSQSVLTLTLAVNDTYCKDTACECVHAVARRRYVGLQKLLKSKYNIELKLVYFVEPYDMEKKLIAQVYDGVICKPWSAFMHVPKYGMKYRRIVDVLDINNKQWLTGLFMVKKDSPVKSLADITGKRLVAGQPDAYEKYHSPLHMLREKGVKPSKLYEKASCIECIGELLDNKADVAIVSNYVMTATCAVDIAKPSDFRIISETEKMPLTSVILDFNKVGEADALRLREALLALSGVNAPKDFASKGFVAPARWSPKAYRTETADGK